MAKITGFLQKVFGQDAANIGQVGSAALGTKLITNDPDTIQALTAFTNGVSDVTITAKRLIPQEEFMALHYLHTLQNAYQQQEGIQEYNSDVTYFTNSIVKKSGTYELYGSLVDNNTGNALTDGTKWVLLTDLSDLSFVANLNYSGYQKLPTGLIIQWAQVSTTSGTGTWTYPISFPSDVYIVGACQNVGGTIYAVGANRSSGTPLVKAELQSGYTGGVDSFYVFAIGK